MIVLTTRRTQRKVRQCALVILCVAALLGGSPQALADCSSFHCGFEDTCACDVIGDPPSSQPGVHGNAMCWSGDGSLQCSGDSYGTSHGSVSLWFRKSSGAEAGGIWQLGSLGTPNGLGLFYHETTSITFELRMANNELCGVYLSGAVFQANWTHIVTVWEELSGVYHLKLFVNGEPAGGMSCPGPAVHEYAALDVGRTSLHGNAEGCFDELRFFDWALLDSEAYAEYVYSSGKFVKQPATKPASTGPVRIAGQELLVNDAPFLIKGVGYQPLPIGACNTAQNLADIYTDPNIIERDLPLLRSMGANTVRVWAHLPDATLLDALYNDGEEPIYAILAIEVPSSNDDPDIDYSDPDTILALETAAENYVRDFKSHPGVLAWAIGNENNLHYTGDVSDWYRLANALAAAIFDEETSSGATTEYHPTMVVNGQMRFFGNSDLDSDDASLGDVDLWGHNSYGASDYHCYFDYYRRLSAKPLVITEFGVDAYDSRVCGEEESVQAQWVAKQWDQIQANCLGGMVMEYSDEWWKGICHDVCDAGEPECVPACDSHETGGAGTDVQPDEYANEEWWGLMRVVDNGTEPDLVEPREVYYRLKGRWTRAVPAMSQWGVLALGFIIAAVGVFFSARRVR